MSTLDRELALRAQQHELSLQEKARYSRHLLLPEVGARGQKRLRAARVLVIGAGGLGSPVALYLAAAGVGALGLVDFDQVELSNLQRQIIHGEADVGRPKWESARERLQALDPRVTVEPHPVRLTRENAMQLISQYDLVVDGTDNFPTRYLVNDCCVFLGKPNIYGSIFGFDGQASVFYPPGGPCYRCLFPAPPPPGHMPNCAEAGVLGVLPGQIGMIQATETIKLILGLGSSLMGRLLLYDALAMTFQELKIPKDCACPVCGVNPTITEPIDYEWFCGNVQPGNDQMVDYEEISVHQLKQLRDAGAPHLLLDVRSEGEADICSIKGAVLMPLNQLESRLGELNPNQHTVVHCRSGVRSANAAKLLKQNGFSHVDNLKGGILAWLDAFDPHQPKY